MSISHIPHRYIDKVMERFCSDPLTVVNAYQECWPYKFDQGELTTTLIRECAILYSDSGFDNAASFTVLWQAAVMEVSNNPTQVAYHPHLSLVQEVSGREARVIATFNNVEKLRGCGSFGISAAFG